MQVGPTHIALYLLPPEQQQAEQHTAAQPAWEDVAAGGQEQISATKRAADRSAASGMKQARELELLGTGAAEPNYSARPRRTAAAAALEGIHVMATTSGDEEDASDDEPPAVGRAGSVSAGKEVGSAPGSRDTVQTSAEGNPPSGGRVDVLGLVGSRSGAAGGVGAEASGRKPHHPYPPEVRAMALTEEPATAASDGPNSRIRGGLDRAVNSASVGRAELSAQASPAIGAASRQLQQGAP